MTKTKRQKLDIKNNWGSNKHGGILQGLKQPEYLQVAVMKTNVETMQAVHYIAKKTKKFAKQFGIAGNKDKRGITTQLVTINRGNPEVLICAQKSKDWDSKIQVGSFERVY